MRSPLSHASFLSLVGPLSLPGKPTDSVNFFCELVDQYTIPP